MLIAAEPIIEAGHPTISVFGETLRYSFPLIFGIGREPNTVKRIAPGVGPYDFRRSPHCGFWNTSYGTIAHIIGWRTWELKRLCELRKASPLIYADALPIGIRNEVSRKEKERQRLLISGQLIDEHINAILSQVHIMNRVGLVLISGLAEIGFDRSAAAIRNWCKQANKQLVELPYFIGSNTDGIRASMNASHHSIVADIIRAFIKSTGG